MEVLKADTFVEMAEICEKYITSGIVETTLSYLPRTPVNPIYPTSPWPICHKEKKKREGLEDTLHQLYKLGSQCKAGILTLLYKEPIVGTTQWPTQKMYYQMVSCFLTLWVVKGRHTIRSDYVWRGSFLVKPNS